MTWYELKMAAYKRWKQDPQTSEYVAEPLLDRTTMETAQLTAKTRETSSGRHTAHYPLAFLSKAWAPALGPETRSSSTSLSPFDFRISPAAPQSDWKHGRHPAVSSMSESNKSSERCQFRSG